MRKFLLMLAAVAATGGCAAQGSHLAPLEKVETVVGLLVPATSERARELGVVAWDIRTGGPGTQIAAITADNRRLGTIFYTLMAHQGVDASLLVMRLKLGERGQLAVANDGTVVEDSLSRIPGSGNFLEAIDEDLELMDAPGVVPYAGGPCATEMRATARSCVQAALWTAGCVATKVPGVCGRAAVGIGRCGFNAYRTYECGRPPGADERQEAIDDAVERGSDAGAGDDEPPRAEPSPPNWCASYADCPSESEDESGTTSGSDTPEATSDDENPWPSDATEGEPTGTSDDDTTDFDYPDDGSSGAPESDPADEEPTGTSDDDTTDFDYPDESGEPEGSGSDPGSASADEEPDATPDDGFGDYDYPDDGSDESEYPPSGESEATSDDGFGDYEDYEDYEGYGGDDTNDDGFEDDWTAREGGTTDTTDEPWTEEDSGWDDEDYGSSEYEDGATSDDGYGDYDDYGTSSSGDDYYDDSSSGGSGGDDYYEEDSGGSAGDYYDDSASGGSGGDDGSGGSDSGGGDYYDDSSSGGSGGDDGGGGGGDEGIWT